MIVRRLHGAGEWMRQHHKRLLVIGIVGFLVLVTTIQFRYPSELLLPYTTIDGVNFGVQSKTSAVLRLDNQYKEKPVGLYFGSGTSAYRSPKPADIGIKINNNERIKNIDYPWYLRLAPGSILWGHFVIDTHEPKYTYDSETLKSYITKEFGESCNITPQNATIKIVNRKLELVKGSPGGTCNTDEVTKVLGAVKVSITSDVKVNLPIKEIPADVSNTSAKQLLDEINSGIKNGVELTFSDSTATVTRDQLIDWLDFTTIDGKLDYSFNVDRASAFLNEKFASKTAKPAGVTTINTYNFAEVSRVTGPSGQALDVAGTLAHLKSFVSGDSSDVTVATSVVAPSVKYTRSYSNDNEGLSALMQNYATTHPGTYGVVLAELSGQYRRATYNATKVFTPASTYKLFVAYSTLRRIEAGTWHWNDQVTGGRDLAKCFDDMIVLSDNACALALLEKIGHGSITNEARAIGCTHTTFLDSSGIKTTAEDLALLLAELQTGQILSQQSSRDLLINAMKRNIYRQGIPKGINATVADKVGFLDGLLHDAAIVYASTGPYVLVIMTDGSSWANIAELTRQIEALRLQ